MQQVMTADAPEGTVVSELVRGYTLHGRLVRPALVSVAVAPGGTAAQKVDEGVNGA
jgi:molecular chaperone GrpE (heat shock protein)